MLIASAAILALFVFGMVFYVREEDLPKNPPPSPTQHLEERRAVIYESLRDLNFEYRVGKLSDADYQATKTGLQRELAGILAEIDTLGATQSQKQTTPKPAPKQQPKAAKDRYICPHCEARFSQPLKFCGECGKPMGEPA